MQEVNVMSDKELVTTEIAHYTDLLRAIQAEDREKELKNQLRVSRAKLESLGVTVENIWID